MINLQPALRPSLSPVLRAGKRGKASSSGPPPAAQAAQLLLVPTAGLFKDVAGTIPATLAGDKIACWKDMRNGLMFTQANVSQQPMLAFVSGKPVVRVDVFGQHLVLSHTFAGITVNSSAVFGYYATTGDYTVFDGPNDVSTFTRASANGKAYPGTFLGARLVAWMDVPASSKLVMSLSRQEGSYNGRINGVESASSPVQTLNNTGGVWKIGLSVGLGGTSFLGDIFGIAIYSTPAGTAAATHIAGVAEIENYISGFYPALSMVVVASTSKGTSAGGGHTDPIDTTGAKLIVLNLAYYSAGTLTGVHDSQGNVYTPLDPHLDVSTGVIQQLWYCEAPATGVAHQFQINGATIFASVQAAAFGGDVVATPFDQQAGGIGAGSSLAIGPVGQAGVYSLVVAGVGFSDTTPGPITGAGGFIVLETTPYVFGAHFGGGLAFKFSDSQILHNVTWDLAAPMSGIAAGIATFQAI